MSRRIGNKIAVFASGFGSNLQCLIDAQQAGELFGEIALVVSDKKDAFALERARKYAIESAYVDPKKAPNRQAYDDQLLALVRHHDVSLVVLAGFMRILQKNFVAPMLGRIINIHPSLLPSYPGTNSIERAFLAKEKKIGVTVHFVDEGVDTGPIVLQESISVHENETLQELTERVHRLEHRLLPKAVNIVMKNELQSKGGV